MNKKSLYFAKRITRHANVAAVITEHKWKDSMWAKYFDMESNKPNAYYNHLPIHSDFCNLVSDLRLHHGETYSVEVTMGNPLREAIKKHTAGVTDPDVVIDITLDLINKTRLFMDDCNNTSKTALKDILHIFAEDFGAGKALKIAIEVIDNVEEGSLAYDFKSKKCIHNTNEIDYGTCVLTKDLLKSIINLRDHNEIVEKLYGFTV